MKVKAMSILYKLVAIYNSKTYKHIRQLVVSLMSYVAAGACLYSAYEGNTALMFASVAISLICQYEVRFNIMKEQINDLQNLIASRE